MVPLAKGAKGTAGGGEVDPTLSAAHRTRRAVAVDLIRCIVDGIADIRGLGAKDAVPAMVGSIGSAEIVSALPKEGIFWLADDDLRGKGLGAGVLALAVFHGLRSSDGAADLIVSPAIPFDRCIL